MASPILSDIAVYTYIIPALTGIIRYKSLVKTLKVFVGLCVLIFILTMIEDYLSLRGIKNLYLSNASFMLDPLLLVIVFILGVKRERMKNQIIVSLVVFVLFAVVEKILLENPNEINTLLAIVSRIYLVIVSLMVLHDAMKETESDIISRPMFWIATSTILYSAGTITVIGLGNELMKIGKSYFIAAWYINWILIIVSNLMYTKAFFCKAQK